MRREISIRFSRVFENSPKTSICSYFFILLFYDICVFFLLPILGLTNTVGWRGDLAKVASLRSLPELGLRRVEGAPVA
jgi:hypothetical protein